MNNQPTYKTSHTAPDYGQQYNDAYSAGYYAALFREVELPILRELWSTLGKDRSPMLDFACGTGRITKAAAPYFSRIVGVDISPEMLKSAQQDERIEYRLRDISQDPLDERFGFVTSFRFFLNAEQELRVQALKAIRRHIADDGRLVCNIHMNARSPLGLFYRLGGLVGLPSHNTLSLEHFRSTLQETGFEVERVIWYGVIPRPGRYFARLMDRLVGPAERAAAKVGMQGRFAQSFILVARPTGTRDTAEI